MLGIIIVIALFVLGALLVAGFFGVVFSVIVGVIGALVVLFMIKNR